MLSMRKELNAAVFNTENSSLKGLKDRNIIHENIQNQGRSIQ